MATHYLYLHGFASGPRSTKGMAFADHLARQGIALDRLDLRVPSFQRPRLSAMLEVARRAIGAEHDRSILFGSSLGGLAAARVAERDRRVLALVLLAPAFQLIERWKLHLGDAYDHWQRTGWRDVLDYTTNRMGRVDFGFCEDAAAIDTGFPDVHVPTLILHGVRDDVVPIEQSRRFASERPHVQLVELDDGHELVDSIPRLLEETDRFLAQLSS